MKALVVFILTLTALKSNHGLDASLVYGEVLLVSPILAEYNDDFGTDKNQMRFISYSDTLPQNLNSKIEEINYFHYRNLNWIYEPSEEEQKRIYGYLLDNSDREIEDWVMAWPKNMNFQQFLEAKSKIGIEFCKLYPKSDEETGYVPILDFEYFKTLYRYNYISDILEAYELGALFKAKIFEDPQEAKAWGLMQLQALRNQYSYFNAHITEADPMIRVLPKSQHYFGSMGDRELNEYFEKFKLEYKDLVENNRFDFLKVIQI